MSRGQLKCLAAGKVGGQAHELNASAKSPSTETNIPYLNWVFLIKTLSRLGYLATFLDCLLKFILHSWIDNFGPRACIHSHRTSN